MSGVSEREINWLLNEKYGGRMTPKFFRDLKRLKHGEPLDYIIGWSDFLHCRISLKGHPLIPRTETEYWVERAIADIQSRKHRFTEPIRVLDLCAGSGCIGVAVLKHTDNTNVDFIEIDNVLHATIRTNIMNNGIDPARAKVYGGSLFEKAQGDYDYILTNPPYIPTSRYETLPREVTDWEPHRALFAGTDGHMFVSEIIKSAPHRLSRHGVLYMEFDTQQKSYLEQIAASFNAATDFFRDQYGRWRSLRATFPFHGASQS